jgi:hypothetical protein
MTSRGWGWRAGKPPVGGFGPPPRDDFTARAAQGPERVAAPAPPGGSPVPPPPEASFHAKGPGADIDDIPPTPAAPDPPSRAAALPPDDSFFPTGADAAPPPPTQPSAPSVRVAAPPDESFALAPQPPRPGGVKTKAASQCAAGPQFAFLKQTGTAFGPRNAPKFGAKTSSLDAAPKAAALGSVGRDEAPGPGFPAPPDGSSYMRSGVDAAASGRMGSEGFGAPAPGDGGYGSAGFGSTGFGGFGNPGFAFGGFPPAGFGGPGFPGPGFAGAAYGGGCFGAPAAFGWHQRRFGQALCGPLRACLGERITDDQLAVVIGELYEGEMARQWRPVLPF